MILRGQQNDFCQSVWIWEPFQHRLSFEDFNWKPLPWWNDSFSSKRSQTNTVWATDLRLVLSGRYFVIVCWSSFISRCVHQECISIRRSVRPSVGPSIHRSVGPSVCWSVSPSVCPSVGRKSVRYACAKTAFLGCFWPRWDPTLKQRINLHVMRVFSPVCSSIFLSVHMLYDQYTPRHSPDASLPGRAH